MALPLSSWAQEGNPLDCFKAQEIIFPLSKNDFSKSEIIVSSSTANAVYYSYQDKYSFWYKFVANADATILFSVSAARNTDRYGVNVYRYSETDFCEKLVNEGLEPELLPRSPIFSESNRIHYLNALDVKKGEIYFVTVLSITADDCGHFLRVESEGEKLSIHAIHRPCYDFAKLESPDFSAAKIHQEDVSLFIAGLDKPPVETEENPAEPLAPVPPTGYQGLTTVVVESAEDDFISVGDRLVLNEVFFYTNTYAFKPEAETELKQLLEFLQNNPGLKIEIQGHTANNTEDIKPDPNFKGQGKSWNFKGNSIKLSEERANAVREYLSANGVEKKRLTAVGYGDTQKRVNDVKTFEEAEKNMRVEVLITGK
jgi:outer membrane protein OmpA-like peptidoglycan-associated protein